MPTTKTQSDVIDPTCQHLQCIGDQVPALPDLAREIRALIGVARDSIVEIGQKLIAAKARVEHGEWLPWLATEFGWNARTAQKYMQVAEAFAIKYEPDSFLDLTIDASALYTLASPKVPEDARDEAIKTAKAGTHVTKRVAQGLIKAAAQAAPPADTDTDVVDTTEDADAIDATETDDDFVFPDRPPIPNDARWQETVRNWIDEQRDKSIPLKDVTWRFAETIPLHDASRRWYFDFEELGGNREMRDYALLVFLRSLGVKFSQPLGRGLYPAPETHFTVPPRRRRR
jgi:hypothetical protein